MRVVFPPKHLCRFQNVVQTEGEVGVVERLDERFGDHSVIVVFTTVRHPPFNDPWVRGFNAVKLEPIRAPG